MLLSLPLGGNTSSWPVLHYAHSAASAACTGPVTIGHTYGPENQSPLQCMPPGSAAAIHPSRTPHNCEGRVPIAPILRYIQVPIIVCSKIPTNYSGSRITLWGCRLKGLPLHTFPRLQRRWLQGLSKTQLLKVQ